MNFESMNPFQAPRAERPSPPARESGSERRIADALLRIDEYRLELETADENNARELLLATMRMLERLGRELPAEHAVWKEIVKRYESLLDTKQRSGKEVSRIFSDIFDEFNDFIEDEFVARKMEEAKKSNRAGRVFVADVMQEVYGRTKEEIEDLKKKNRERVSEKILELKEQPYTTFEDLVELHRINNRGVVPKEFSRARKAELDEEVSFKARIGTFAEDLPEELRQFDERVGSLIDDALVGNVGDSQYEIGVAKLHNDLLEMHAFSDRNGSTALIFIELMMARKGYKPPAKRERNYYKALGKALGFNPVAMALVGYEHYKISHEPGFFEGVTSKGKERKYSLALRVLKRIQEQNTPDIPATA